MVRYLGADVRLVDIDPKTLNIDLRPTKRHHAQDAPSSSRCTGAGLAADMLELLDIARRHGLRVVEDAAHALPTTIGEELIGTLGSDATVFSFYANKTMTTGEGGMLVTRTTPSSAKRARVMRLHGMNRDAFDRFTAKVPSWYYEIVAPGCKYNLTDIAAALGSCTSSSACRPFRRDARPSPSATKPRLPTCRSSCRPRRPEGDTHSWHLYVPPRRHLSHRSAMRFIEGMFAAGIGCSVHHVPLHLRTLA